MRISAKAQYACLAVIELAMPGSNGSPKRIRDIAEAQGLPERYLVQILLQLKAAGLVHSARGSVGGYQLVRSAEQVSIADVVMAIDGPGDPPREVASPVARDLADVFERARAAELTVLASATVAQFTRPTGTHDWVL